MLHPECRDQPERVSVLGGRFATDPLDRLEPELIGERTHLPDRLLDKNADCGKVGR